MTERRNKANDLFLLMLNLSQVSLKEKIIDIFLEAIKEIWQNISITFTLSSSEKENTIIELSSAGSHYGFICIHNFSELKCEDQDLLHNACGMLSIILKKKEHEELIADEKLHLEKLVEERTQHLSKENRDRKRAEEKLLESEAKYRHLYETMSQGVVIQDTEGRILEANQAACELLGLTMDQLLGKTVYDPRWKMIREDGAPYDPEDMPSNIALRTGKPVKGFHCGIYVPEKEQYRWIVIGSVPRFKDGETKPFVTTTVFTDITERKRSEEALRESRTQLKSALESMSDAVFISNKQGQFIEFNEAFATFHRLENKAACIKDLSGWPDFLDVYTMNGTLVSIEMWVVNRALRGETGVNVEYRLHRKDTGETWFGSYNFAPIRDKEGRIWGSVVVARDITENRKLQEQVTKAQKMESIGTLAGGIAHDFNNILFPIVGYTQMLLEDVPDDSPFRDSLKEIYTSALRAKGLVKQILTFSRQESSELILMKMQPIVKEVLKLIRSTIPTTIEIKQDINPDCGIIKADPTQIHQIVMNLSTNAFHAMEETGGELKVRLEEIELGEYDILRPDMKPGVYACLTIADTGVGMDKNVIDKIFDPFFTTKAMGKGTGMGLSVVHGIVTKMNGAIQVYSEPGEGTQFHVYLPLEKHFSEEPVTSSKIGIQGGTEQILLVDDDEAILSMEKRMLERLGYQVTSRTSSIEALEVFRNSPDRFDMVITDMAMPNMPGDKLSVELVKIRSDIPILLCTGFSETMSEERAASLGIKGFLWKPIIMKDLAHKIREVLE